MISVRLITQAEIDAKLRKLGCQRTDYERAGYRYWRSPTSVYFPVKVVTPEEYGLPYWYLDDLIELFNLKPPGKRH